jgi:hypothetical protein
VNSGAVLAALACAALSGDVDELARKASKPAGHPHGRWCDLRMQEGIMSLRSSDLVHTDDAKVKPEPGPAGYTTTTVARLKALGLPAKCVGGEVVENVPIDTETRWCVFRSNDGLFGFAYEVGPRPFGRCQTVELTIMEEFDDGTMQQLAA